MGCQPLLPGQFLAVGEPDLETFLTSFKSAEKIPPRATTHHNTPLPTSLPPELMAADFVLVRRDGVKGPLAPPYDGPYRVERRSLHSFQVRVGTRLEEISTHRLKVCRAPPDTAAAEPPRRGRPPRLSPPGAISPKQNPGEKTSSQNRAEQTAGSSLNQCPRGVNPIGKNPRAATLKLLSKSAPPTPPADRSAGGSDPVPASVPVKDPTVAAKSAGKTKDGLVPQPTLRKKQTAVPRGVVSRSAPALPSDGRAGRSIKRVRFSCRVDIIPQVFSRTPPDIPRCQSPDSFQAIGPDPPVRRSGRPIRFRRPPDRYGIGPSPRVSRPGGDL